MEENEDEVEEDSVAEGGNDSGDSFNDESTVSTLDEYVQAEAINVSS